jgi:hypothetical protein
MRPLTETEVIRWQDIPAGAIQKLEWYLPRVDRRTRDPLVKAVPARQRLPAAPDAEIE